MSTEGFDRVDLRPNDPLGDAADLAGQGAKHNYAKVGSSRPSSLIHTYGPGALLDLPHFTVLPLGFDDWEPVWNRRGEKPAPLFAPRLLEEVRTWLGWQVKEIRPYPRQENPAPFTRDGADLGVPAVVFPQWFRCTGCDRLAPLELFEYVNTHPYRPDEAHFEHAGCTGRPRRDGAPARSAKRKAPTAVPARYLLVCLNGHLDEFLYSEWVHGASPCVENPPLAMVDHTGGKGASAAIECRGCGARRRMNEAQGQAGRAKLPQCRGRHPHLDGYDRECGLDTRLMLVGASNLWFSASASVIVMPMEEADRDVVASDALLSSLGSELLEDYADRPERLRSVAQPLLPPTFDLGAFTDDELAALARRALAPEPAPSAEEQDQRRQVWDPIDILRPEWAHLTREVRGQQVKEPSSGLVLSQRDAPDVVQPLIARVVAVDRLRKINALLGFTRVDNVDRLADAADRLVRLSRDQRPGWTVGTEDLGEGIFIQLHEPSVADWERRVASSDLWQAHRAAHRTNVTNRWSETAEIPDIDARLRPPRYWLVHTLAHVVIRELAAYSGYGAASMIERIYAWEGTADRPPAAGLLIATTASDSDGTLGGLVRLSQPELLGPRIEVALRRAGRCSSDPICAQRLPRDPEDFLHGAACHCCVFASETTCERSNRFLDRRFLVLLPGNDLAFFASP
ncbi:MAG: DrmB family protein [Phycicoccus sp.]